MIWIAVLLGSYLALTAGLFHHYAVRFYRAGTWLSGGAVLVDVDGAGDFAARHPDVAISVPFASIGLHVDELRRGNRAIVVFAHSWRCGAKAVHALRRLGCRRVMNAAGMRVKGRLTAVLLRAVASRPSSPAQSADLGAVGGGAKDPTFARILIPIDYSASSRLALTTALALQRGFGSEVHLFHLAQVGADDRFIAGTGGDSVTARELVLDSEERLHRFVDNVCPGHANDVLVHASEGVEIVDGIERVAKEVGATLVLLAHGATDSVFRTHVEKVARRLHGAVLLL